MRFFKLWNMALYFIAEKMCRYYFWATYLFTNYLLLLWKFQSNSFSLANLRSPFSPVSCALLLTEHNLPSTSSKFIYTSKYLKISNTCSPAKWSITWSVSSLSVCPNCGVLSISMAGIEAFGWSRSQRHQKFSCLLSHSY